MSEWRTALAGEIGSYLHRDATPEEIAAVVIEFLERAGDAEYEEGVRTLPGPKFLEIHRHALILRDDWIEGHHAECDE